ncbi:hypothetical protein ACOMHN_022736 [Nucella lapillus]
MARPTKDEVDKVGNVIRNIRKKVFEDNIQRWKIDFEMKLSHTPELTELSSWKPKCTDPRKIYSGNTDHWAKMRVQADLDVSRGRLSESSPKATDRSTALQRTVDTVRCLEVKTFPQMVRESLQPTLPGTLSRNISKRCSKSKLKWPNNAFHQQTIDNPKYKYCICDDTTTTATATTTTTTTTTTTATATTTTTTTAAAASTATTTTTTTTTTAAAAATTTTTTS